MNLEICFVLAHWYVNLQMNTKHATEIQIQHKLDLLTTSHAARLSSSAHFASSHTETRSTARCLCPLERRASAGPTLAGTLKHKSECWQRGTFISFRNPAPSTRPVANCSPQNCTVQRTRYHGRALATTVIQLLTLAIEDIMQGS
jgi:hypothetical protein